MRRNDSPDLYHLMILTTVLAVIAIGNISNGTRPRAVLYFPTTQPAQAEAK
jgi:hypothetical protein